MEKQKDKEASFGWTQVKNVNVGLQHIQSDSDCLCCLLNHLFLKENLNGLVAAWSVFKRDKISTDEYSQLRVKNRRPWRDLNWLSWWRGGEVTVFFLIYKKKKGAFHNSSASLNVLALHLLPSLVKNIKLWFIKRAMKETPRSHASFVVHDFQFSNDITEDFNIQWVKMFLLICAGSVSWWAAFF